MRKVFYIMTIVLTLFACSDTSKEELFNRFVYEGSLKEIKNLESGRVSCMHCPLFFKFEADSDSKINNAIISKYGLEEVNEYPKKVASLNIRINKQVNWWGLVNKKTNERIYWVHYLPKTTKYEPKIKVLIVKDNNSFIITNGYFDSKYYEKE